MIILDINLLIISFQLDLFAHKIKNASNFFEALAFDQIAIKIRDHPSHHP